MSKLNVCQNKILSITTKFQYPKLYISLLYSLLVDPYKLVILCTLEFLLAIKCFYFPSKNTLEGVWHTREHFHAFPQEIQLLQDFMTLILFAIEQTIARRYSKV